MNRILPIRHPTLAGSCSTRIKKQYWPMQQEVNNNPGKIRIVIVDDDPDALELMSFFLVQMPEVEIAGKFKNAREALRGLKNMEPKPHIVFTDISMPEMDGIQLSKKIRRFLPEIQFVFITAYSHYAPDTQEIKPIGFLQKPIEASELRHCIKLFLARLNSLPSSREL